MFWLFHRTTCSGQKTDRGSLMTVHHLGLQGPQISCCVSVTDNVDLHPPVVSYVSTGPVLRSRDGHLALASQHPHRQALHHSSVPQQPDLRVRWSHQVHILLRPHRGLLDARGPNFQQTGTNECRSAVAAGSKAVSDCRFCRLGPAGELRHVSVQR